MSNWRGIIGQAFTPEEFRRYCERTWMNGWRPLGTVLHNTGAPTLAGWMATRGGGEARMRGLEHYYRDEQKWSAGPHLFVEPARIWVFSPLTSPGVHSPSYNGTHFGVETVGDFDTEEFTAEHQATVVSALASLADLAGFPAASLKLHQEDPRTTHKGCPGRNLARKKAEIITQVEAALQARAARQVAVEVDGKRLEAPAFVREGKCAVAIRPVASALGWALHSVANHVAHLGHPERGVAVMSFWIEAGVGYVPARELERLGVIVDWNDAEKKLKVSTPRATNK